MEVLVVVVVVLAVDMVATRLHPPAQLLHLHRHILNNNMVDILLLHPHKIIHHNQEHHPVMAVPRPVMALHLQPVARQVLRMVDMDNRNSRHRHQQLHHQHQELHIVAVTDLLSPRVMTKAVATTLEATVHRHQQVETMEVNRTVAMVVDLPAVVATMQVPQLVLTHSLEALHQPMEVVLLHKEEEEVMEDLHQEVVHMGHPGEDLQEDMGLHHQMEIMGDKVVDITKEVVAVAMVVVVILAVAVVVAAAIEMVAGILVMMKTRWCRRIQSLFPICQTKQQKILLRIISDKLG